MADALFTADFKETPYWWDAAPRLALPETPIPARADAVVVGSGQVGLSAALTLARAGWGSTRWCGWGERAGGSFGCPRVALIYVARPARWRLGTGSSPAGHGSVVRGRRGRFVSVSVRTAATSAFDPKRTLTGLTLN